MPKPLSGEYYNGLDGLRAVAVVLVVVFHFYEIYMPAGFIGVDMFFAISGFLITGILLKAENTGISAVVDFFWRRIARLYPALVVVLLTFVVLSFLGLIKWKPDFAEFASLSLSLHNIYLIFHTVDYFKAFLQETPFLHFWSLGLEWQLYIIASIAVLVAGFFGRHFKVAVFIFYAIAFFSALYASYYFGYVLKRVDIAYYSPLSHSMSFWAGGIAYFIAQKAKKSEIGNAVFLIIGLLCVGFAVFVSYYSDKESLILFSFELSAYPFLFLLSAILSFGAIISVAFSKHFSAVIGNSVFVWLGERSYGIYLWHFPLLILFSSSLGKQNFYAHYDYILIYALSVLIISDISWRAIEDKFRRHNFLELANIVSYKVAVFTALLVVIIFYHSGQNANASAGSMQIAIKAIDANITENNDTNRSNETNISQELNTTTEYQGVYVRIPDCSERQSAIEGKEITAIGDSVFLDIKPTLEKKFPHIHIDAKVSRQFHHLPALLDEMDKSNAIRKNVLIALGTNGFIYKRNLIWVVDFLSKKGANIIFIVPYAPEEWQTHNSQILREFAQKYPNIVLIDWESASKKETQNVFVEDKTHLNSYGLKVYAKLVTNHLCTVKQIKSNEEEVVEKSDESNKSF